MIYFSLYIAIDTVFHPSGIIQNGRRNSFQNFFKSFFPNLSYDQSFNYIMKLVADFFFYLIRVETVNMFWLPTHLLFSKYVLVEKCKAM